MMNLERNHARIYAEGFYAVFIEPKTQDREALVAYLADAFEDAYCEGLRSRQREFAKELLAAIGDRTSVPATELRQLVSSLKAAPAVE
jgi:hypothetical protein